MAGPRSAAIASWQAWSRSVRLFALHHVSYQSSWNPSCQGLLWSHKLPIVLNFACLNRLVQSTIPCFCYLAYPTGWRSTGAYCSWSSWLCWGCLVSLWGCQSTERGFSPFQMIGTSNQDWASIDGEASYRDAGSEGFWVLFRCRSYVGPFLDFWSKDILCERVCLSARISEYILETWTRRKLELRKERSTGAFCVTILPSWQPSYELCFLAISLPA
jgi:hypothetical protein